MMWIGLVVGGIVGAIIGDAAGAVALGFLGWLAGLIYSSLKKRGKRVDVGAGGGAAAGSSPAAPIPVMPQTGHWTMEDRVARLETLVARIEARLTRFETGAVTPAAP